MKKIIFLLALLPLLSFGQKIKIKKNKVLFNKQEVAIMESPVRDNYTIKYLSGDKAFDIVFHGLTVTTTEGQQWLELKNPEGIKAEIPYEILMTSLSVKKLIIKLLSAKYSLIDTNGVNKEKVKAFFLEKHESLSDKYLKAATSAKMDQEKRARTIGKYQPFVKGNGTIVFGGSMGTGLRGKAYYKVGPYAKKYSIYDLDNNEIAVATQKKVTSLVDVKTFTGEEFSFDYGSKTMFTNSFSSNTATIIVEELVGRGYYLGHDAKVYKNRLHKEKVKEAKKNSSNLYGVSGYVIDAKNKKYKGTVYAIFEKLQLSLGEQDAAVYGMNSIDKYGKFVSVRYLNEKGKKRVKKFAAKDKVTFCVDDNGTERCFVGMKTKGNALKKLTNANNFGFDNSYFYELLYNKNGNQLLLSLKDGFYVLKVKDSKVGFMIDDRSSDKLAKPLAKYLTSCKQLSNNVLSEEFDLKNKESLIQIIDEYCK